MHTDLKNIKRIFIAGSIAYDDIMDFPYEFKDHFHPEHLHKINISFVVSNLKRQLGGTATSLAHNFRLVSRSDISLLGAVGKDGEEFIRFFKKNDIGTSFITQDKVLYTATGKVITDIKNNQIWGFYYGASERLNKNALSELKKNTSVLVLSATHKKPFMKLQNDAVKNNVMYIYDPGMVLTWISDRDLRIGVLGSRMIIANDYEMAQIVKRINLSTEELCLKGVAVVTTLGGKGVVFQDMRSKHLVRAYKVRNIIDPTGAGDAFRAGFISGLIEEKAIVDSLKQGNALASFAIEKYGTTNHHPTKKQIHDRMSKLII